jgi:multidrug efflux pump
MRSFTDVFIKHPVLAVVVNLVIVLMGWRAISTLPVQQYPKIESSSVVITTVYYGASAETVRGFLTTPIERAVSAISGVDHIESTSRAGVSTVTVRMKLNHPSTAALAEVTARLQQVRSELPGDAEPPAVEVQRADRPYASFYLSFASSARDVPAVTDWLTRTLQPQLSTLPGVQRVSFEGARPIAMRVWIDPDKLAALNLSPGDVQGALRRNNYLAAVGQTKGNLVQVNLLANTDLRSVDEFKDLIVADRGGALVRLRDVARVELGAEEASMVAKFDRQEAVYLGVWPLVGVNEIEVAHRLREEMERIRPTLPPDIDMRLAFDATTFMEDALEEISKTLVETVLIVGVVVFLFMGSVRTALVPLVAMPVSLIGAAGVMYAFGFSLNLLTILAIVLSVGLVVDDAIVVVENVERHVRLGKTRVEAALVGARELVGPILAMTITLAAVYAPIGFQGGLTGSLFLEFAITLAAAVVLSGVVAVTLSPVMSSRFVHEHGREGRLTALVNRGFDRVRDAYARLLDGRAAAPPGGGRRRAARDGGGVAALHVLQARAGAGGGPEPHQPLHAGVARRLARRVQPRVAAGGRRGPEVPETEFMWSLTASWGAFGGLKAKDWKGRDRTTAEMYGEVYGAVSQIPGLRVFPRLDPPLRRRGSTTWSSCCRATRRRADARDGRQGRRRRVAERQVPVRRHRPEDRPPRGARDDRPRGGGRPRARPRVGGAGARHAARRRVREPLQLLRAELQGHPAARRRGPRDGGAAARPQDQDARRAARAGVLVHAHRDRGGAAHAQPLPAAQRRAGVRRRAPGRHEGGGAARARGGGGLGGRAGLRRHDRPRGRVAADPPRGGRAHRDAGVRGGAHLPGARRAVPELPRPAHRAVRLRATRDLGALVFSFLDLTTINIYSQVGLITLVGLIAKNGILIVEFANTLQAQGLAKLEALREASLTRLRPVLMTSVATVFGHLPLVFVSGPGSEARNSIGMVLVTGMVVGTLFTLFVVPVFYSLIAADHRRADAREGAAAPVTHEPYAPEVALS